MDLIEFFDLETQALVHFIILGLMSLCLIITIFVLVIQCYIKHALETIQVNAVYNTYKSPVVVEGIISQYPRYTQTDEPLTKDQDHFKTIDLNN